MYTVLFIDNGNPFTCGFRLNSFNWFKDIPSGIIRIARFETSFSPDKGHGYYGDIYLKRFIRIWKFKIIQKRRQIEKKMAVLCFSKNNILNKDTIRYIVDFL